MVSSICSVRLGTACNVLVIFSLYYSDSACNVLVIFRLYYSDSEGLLKLWTLKTNVCEKTFVAHENKAWALTQHPAEELIFTGGADSTLITWKVSTGVCVHYVSMCLLNLSIVSLLSAQTFNI